MSVKKELEQALKDAMRSKDDLRKSTLRQALTAVKFAEVDKKGELDDPAVLAILQKEVKSRNESIEDARKARRDDLVSAAEAEIAILEEYLPQPLSEAQLQAIVDEAIAEVGATHPGDIGKVMQAVMPKVQGRADGGQVSQLVRQKLQSQ